MPTDHDPPSAADAERETALCLHCLRPLPPPGHFCAHCGAPNSVYATVGPMESVWALGWLVNRLLERRPSSLALVGTSLLCVQSLIGAVLFGAVIAPLRGDAWWSGAFAVPDILVAGAYLTLLARVVSSFVRRDLDGRNGLTTIES